MCHERVEWRGGRPDVETLVRDFAQGSARAPLVLAVHILRAVGVDAFARDRDDRAPVDLRPQVGVRAAPAALVDLEQLCAPLPTRGE